MIAQFLKQHCANLKKYILQYILPLLLPLLKIMKKVQNERLIKSKWIICGSMFQFNMRNKVRQRRAKELLLNFNFGY